MLDGPHGGLESVLTDEEGRFAFEDLRTGAYRFRIGSPAHAPAEHGPIDIPQGGRSDLVFDLAPGVELVVDVLAANILAGTLIELAPRLAAHVRVGGAIVLAGVLERQAELVRAAFAPFFTDFTDATHDGWIRIAATRRAG